MAEKVSKTMLEAIEGAITVVKQKLPAISPTADVQKLGQAVLNLKVAKATYAAMEDLTDDELDEEIRTVVARVRANLSPTDMQQVTQAVLHFVQAKACNAGIEQKGKTPKKQGIGA